MIAGFFNFSLSTKKKHFPILGQNYLSKKNNRKVKEKETKITLFILLSHM
jgi:hypothetical protein